MFLVHGKIRIILFTLIALALLVKTRLNCLRAPLDLDRFLVETVQSERRGTSVMEWINFYQDILHDPLDRNLPMWIA